MGMYTTRVSLYRPLPQFTLQFLGTLLLWDHRFCLSISLFR